MNLKNSSETFFCLLFTLLCANLEAAEEVRYLNSQEHCTNMELQFVRPTTYLLKPEYDRSKTTRTFIDCEMTFMPEIGEDGKDKYICIAQVGKPAVINDGNIELQVKSGMGNPDDPVIDTLKRYPNTLDHQEYCTNGPITVFLRRIEKDTNVDIRKVDLTLRVFPITDRHRKVFLDGNYCNQDSKLKNSVVVVENRSPRVIDWDRLRSYSRCFLTFVKVQPELDRKLCLLYQPSLNTNCKSNWKIEIYDDKRNLLNKLNCSEPKAMARHAFCASNMTNEFSLRFDWNVDKNGNFTPSDRDKFSILAIDFTGTEEDLLNLYSSLGSKDVSEAGFGGVWIAVIVAVGCVLIFVVTSALVRKRGWCAKYKAVNQGQNEEAKV